MKKDDTVHRYEVRRGEKQGKKREREKMTHKENRKIVYWYQTKLYCVSNKAKLQPFTFCMTLLLPFFFQINEKLGS